MFIQSFFSSDFSKIETINKQKNLHSMEALEKAKQLCLKIIFSEFNKIFLSSTLLLP